MRHGKINEVHLRYCAECQRETEHIQVRQSYICLDCLAKSNIHSSDRAEVEEGERCEMNM